jgi:hypothetical protein
MAFDRVELALFKIVEEDVCPAAATRSRVEDWPQSIHQRLSCINARKVDADDICTAGAQTFDR